MSDEISIKTVVDEPAPEGIMQFAVKMLNKHGQYAFGALLLLAIWVVIVEPLIRSKSMELEQLQKIANTMQLTAESMRIQSESQVSIVNGLKTTATLMNKTIETIDRREQRWRMEGNGVNAEPTVDPYTEVIFKPWWQKG